VTTILIGALVLAGAIVALSNIFNRQKDEGCGSGGCSSCSSCATCSMESKEKPSTVETDRNKVSGTV